MPYFIITNQTIKDFSWRNPVPHYPTSEHLIVGFQSKQSSKQLV